MEFAGAVINISLDDSLVAFQLNSSPVVSQGILVVSFNESRRTQGECMFAHTATEVEHLLRQCTLDISMVSA